MSRMTWEELEQFIIEGLTLPASKSRFYSSSGAFFYPGYAEIMPLDAIVYARPTVNGREMPCASSKLLRLEERITKEYQGKRLT